MTTIDQVKKQYDKLTQVERFALLMKAHARNDDGEAKELIRTAPRKSFSFPNTSGLQDAFQFIAMMHIIAQLGQAATFYFLILSDVGNKPIIIGEETFTVERAFEMLARNLIGGRDAFELICKEYKLDPNEVLSRYPYIETMQTGEAIASIGMNDITPELKAEIDQYTQDAVTAYREAIEHYTDGWE